jgi:8-oxo-dGTP pyrophosphatase MutT (NUDIX family)
MPCGPRSKMRKPASSIKDARHEEQGLIIEGIDLGRLRSALFAAPERTVFVAEEGVGDEELIPASVLFPIVLRENGASVLLTQRTDHLRDHPGQVSFPGGRVEPDDSSPAHTALREAQEEIGLAAEHVEIVGYLPEYRTGTGFRVTPVVALVRPPFELSPDKQEVAEIFEVPLAFLMDPSNHQQRLIHNRGKLRPYFAMPYGDYFIWGATAGIIVALHQALMA